MINYLKHLSLGKQLLWSYFIWYINIVILYFDCDIHLWLASIGIALIVGTALVISTTEWPIKIESLENWSTIRLFIIPFCVSSYSSLIKGNDFYLIFPPDINTNIISLSSISIFLLVTFIVKKFTHS